ncbi:MAG TPA: phenylacetic acid degradation bifunctional protein PaaZ, partial [Chitinophagaceae bacterium]|nr:phenylacetic acid degradation bifunctional protein PaaZ [Chitinophagaceae bacterium]
MEKLENYVLGRWVKGDGEGQLLLNAITGQPITSASTKGLDFKDILHYARQRGNANLRKMSFHERGRMLRSLALYLTERKEEFYRISYMTGATRADSWID